MGRFSQAEGIRIEIQYARRPRKPGGLHEGELTSPAETLESVFFTYKDPRFPGRGKTRSVRIPATGRKLKFTFWLQPGQAPVVYLLPGLGSHRMAQTSLALAELAYQNGFSAVHQQRVSSGPWNTHQRR
jgi:hypothetical protein